MGVSCWKPTGLDRRPAKVMRSRRRPPSSWSRAGPWLAPPPSSMSMLGDHECHSWARERAPSSKRWKPFGGMLRRTKVTRVPGATTTAAAAGPQQQSPRENFAKHLGVLLLPPLGWFPAAVADVLRRRPVECAAASAAAAAEPVVAAAGRSMWDVSRPALSVVLQVSCVCMFF